MNELTTTEKKEILPHAKDFLERAKQDIKDVGDRFFMLGCRLYEAQKYNYVQALGYESIEQLAEAELDLGRSSTYNLINVFKRFCARDKENNYYTWVKPEYKNYKYSQLVEIEKAMCLPYNIEKEIPPSTPVRIIKEYIKYFNKNPGDHKSLPEWQTEQEKQKQIEQLPLIEQTLPCKDITPLIVIPEQHPEKSKRLDGRPTPKPNKRKQLLNPKRASRYTTSIRATAYALS